MGLFDKIIDKIIINEPKYLQIVKCPTFIKDFNDKEKNIKELSEIYDSLKNTKKKYWVSNDLYALKQGIYGQRNVYNELKNSQTPMLCLHDVVLPFNDKNIQMDFIIITNQYLYVLETKKLHGNIEINSKGEFTKSYKNKKGELIKEGLYSPVEEARKQVNYLKQLLHNQFGIINLPVKSLIVLSNPKTIIERSNCPRYINDMIIKHEALGNYLREQIRLNRECINDQAALNIANFLMYNNNPIRFDYHKKYQLSNDDFKYEGKNTYANSNNFNYKNENMSVNNHTEVMHKTVHVAEKKIKEEHNKFTNKNMTEPHNELFEQLRLYRNRKAKEEGYDYKKYHYVFSKSVIEELVNVKPCKVEQLFNIKGLGKVKIGKYGDDIINIISTYLKTFNECAASSVPQKEKNNEIYSDNLRAALKKYRLDKAHELNIKAYVIFSNAEMEELINKRPKNIKELYNVKGFKDKKINDYGNDIIRILNS